ncbi:MAG: 3-oxoacyl-ACP reductase FabG [Clostridia bacterium]|nr:3-oxoacyl-ACP reductase FabG [Clostridia bacterium]
MYKTAIVTGGNRGIGLACVRALAKDGYKVQMLYHTRRETAQTECTALREKGYDVDFSMCDVSSAESVSRTFSEILARFRRLDVLVLSAGIAHIAMFQDTTEEDWERLLQVNLLGQARCIQACLPQMLSQKSGSILTLSSMWGEVGASCEVAYSATKAAVIGMARALAKELGPSGIRVNCVSPGVIDTEMNAGLTEEDMQALQDETPLSRIGQAEDVGQAIAFLASEKASFITGQVLGISGGLVV